MEPYLIFSDIDGTLVVDHQIVTPFTKQVIRTLQQRDVIFYIATGRLYNLGKVIARQINDEVRIVASNGAVFEDQNQLRKKRLGKAALKAAYEASQADPGLSAHFFTTDAVYYTQEIPRFVARDAGNLTSMGAEITHDAVTDLDMLMNMSDQIINGIIIGRGVPTALADARQRLIDQDVMSISSSGPDNIELIPKNIDKATAIRQIQTLHDIDADHTFVFGDGQNDLGMLQEAKYSVAMGNALPEVKAVANYVTETNNNDGVARFLQQQFNLEIPNTEVGL
ncbi:HAD family hydrolase [Latilactobacillus fuchuensis]|jgi:Cof subfamily protein (haloacid dehalogenase superfamily)|uniref:Hydrolase, haloacid dehalogenase family n=1 Tax=Latilactobacillus fuchuensis TaxID=164393 RepID=A0A2N9DT98_9LACO|nr:HAD family hydrolase [Latilactobacillus fuchuensis]MCP8857308.1 Cof-type HAD-IIB family hydrolase [Latilactobacillus fuchuensis]SPC36679.1 putative hydrolase, haloacid dehalogenase family [Latilactobacillus fuchuensis]